MLSAAVENFTQTHPNARVELFDLSTAEMLAGLESDNLDVALSVGQRRETRGLKWTPLVRAPWQLAVNRNHPLARRSQVTPAEVAGEPLLVFCQRDYPEYWDIITGWLRDHAAAAKNRRRIRRRGQPHGGRGIGAGSRLRHHANGASRAGARPVENACLPLRSRCASPRAIAPTGPMTSRWRCSSKNCAKPLRLSRRQQLELKFPFSRGSYAGLSAREPGKSGLAIHSAT